MLRQKRYRVWIVSLLAMLSLVGQTTQPVAASSVTWTPTPTHGIEFMKIPVMAGDRSHGDIVVVRIDPTSVLFSVYYHAGQGKTIHDWAAEWPSAAVIINANYFRSRARPIGLVQIGADILNPATGRTDSGVFEMRDEVPSIHPPTQEPHADPVTHRPYIQSFESYPFLIINSKAVTSYAADIPLTPARRTVIAQDDQGRILFIIASPIELTLPEMVQWLEDSQLGIVTALNLDGGASSQLHLPSANLPQLEFGAAVPVVLAVYPR